MRELLRAANQFYVIYRSCLQVCCKGGADHLLLLCDQCDRGFHTYCCNPPLDDIPDDDWYCMKCISSNIPDDQCIVCGAKVCFCLSLLFSFFLSISISSLV